MKTLRVILSIISCMIFGVVSATEYETVYECNFENGNVSEWNLSIADELNELIGNNSYYTYVDVFNIGSAVSSMGSKSLYVSQDNGTSSNILLGNRAFNAGAELNVQLPAGNYTMSFNYRLEQYQNLDIIIFANHLDDMSILFDSGYSTTVTEGWSFQTISFSLSEQANYILFSYGANGSFLIAGQTINGFAIDNIVIKKEVTATNLTQTSAEKTILKEEYFGIDGKPATAQTSGIVIKKITYTDGTVKVEKELR